MFSRKKKLDIANCNAKLLTTILVAMQTLEHRAAMFCDVVEKALAAAELRDSQNA